MSYYTQDSTHIARAALLWVLWHHQGASSEIGQPIRFALGIGRFDRLSEADIQRAKMWGELMPHIISTIGLRQDDALSVSGDIDQGVYVPAAPAQEVAPNLVHLGGDEAEQHLQAAGSALPHDVDGTPPPFDIEKARAQGIEYFAERFPALKEALKPPPQSGHDQTHER